MKPILKPLNEYVYALLRIFAGAMFMLHGSQKILGWPPGEKGMARPLLTSIAGMGGVIELVCGAALLIGLLTTFAAFIASGEMAVGYWMFHATRGFIPNVNKGEMAVLYCFIFLYIAANGAGRWSIDHAIWGRKATATVTATT
ncbi:MAG TPA: DoxX family protein [Thermoanaerobaculia bacterium]|nr:DoxX family protein [Thermoanaerobaculia bacterium]